MIKNMETCKKQDAYMSTGKSHRDCSRNIWRRMSVTGLIVFTHLWLAVAAVAAQAAQPTPVSAQFIQAIQKAERDRQQGLYQSALSGFVAAGKLASNEGEHSQVIGQVGSLLLQTRRYPQAKQWLSRAYEGTPYQEDRKRYAVELGNLVWQAEKNMEQARRYYEEGQTATSAATRVSAAMSMMRLDKETDFSADKVGPIIADIEQIDNAEMRAAMHLRLANLANSSLLKDHKLIFEQANVALYYARQLQHRRITVASLNLLAQLYEESERYEESKVITLRAISRARPELDQDLLIDLEWRRGRLAKQMGHNEWALDAYQKAVGYINEIRTDIPVTFEDGRSSFRETLEPVYLGLSEMLLERASRQKAGSKQRSSYLFAAREVAESIKQSELQDYLGDRCTVDSIKSSTKTRLAADTAVIYPIVLENKVETLVETSTGIQSYTAEIPSYQLHNLAHDFAGDLRSGRKGIEAKSRRLYDILLQEVDAGLSEQKISKLVVVPDGVLRLIPYGALFDGKKYAIEKYAFSVTTGLSLTQKSTGMNSGEMNMLAAGLSNPGPVAEVLYEASIGGKGAGVAKDKGEPCDDKIDKNNFLRLANNLDISQGNLSVDEGSAVEESADAQLEDVKTRALRVADIRKDLKLPGVVGEIEEISKLGTSQRKVLFNKTFTLDNFNQIAQSGKYNIVHIASHGVFGGSGKNSYLLSFDKLITMDALQQFLRSEHLAKKGIELLTLSACETAEGDDRAPLGISGVALASRAKSVLGTLWPVADEAAQQVMIGFYRKFQEGKSKTVALREAQMQLLGQEKFRHPFFWAPFTLVGSWI